MIIGVLNQKGGVGKTTVAVNLAAVFATANNRVLLVDADPQGSSMAWSAARTVPPLFPVVGMAKPTLHRDLPALAKNYEIVLVDGAPGANDFMRSAIRVSDLILIPVQPSPYDVWASATTVKMINEVKIYRDDLEAIFVINRKITNTAIGRDVAGALAQLKLVVADIALCQRVVYAESAARGLSVIEAEPQSEAAKEIARFAHTILIEKVRRAA
jgi:chromosome partitioning protein